MKENKKKAFTIIELLIAIAIIGILAIIAVPAVGKYLENGRQSYYESLGKELIVMAKKYYTDNPKELPRGQQNRIFYKILTLEELEKANYVTNKIVDTNKNSCEESYIAVKNDRTGNYEYQACLICNGITRYGNKEECIFGGLRDNDTPECEIAVKDYTMGTWTNKDVSLTITGYDKTGVGKIEIIGEISLFPKKYEEREGRKVNTSTITIGQKDRTGIVEANVYDVAGNGGYCKTTGQVNIEKTKPTCSIDIVDTTLSTKTIEIELEDEIGGSGVGQLKIEGTDVKIVNNKATYIADKNQIYVATVIDNAGNSNTCSVEIAGLDTEPPDIKLTITPTTSADPSGYVSIVANITDDMGTTGYAITTSSEEPSDWTAIEKTTSTKQTFIKDTAETYYIHALDEAGHRSHKSVTIKLSNWSSYKEKSCNTLNTLLCRKTSGFRKYTRKAGVDKTTVAYCGSGTDVSAAKYTYCGGECTSYAKQVAKGCFCQYKRNGVIKTSTTYTVSYRTFDGCEYYCCSVLKSCQNYYLLYDYRCGTSNVAQGTCCTRSEKYKCNYNCNGITYNHPSYGNSCSVKLSGTRCVVSESRNTIGCPSGYGNEISGKCYQNYPSTFTLVTECNGSNTVKCNSTTLYQTKAFSYTLND